MGYNHCNPYDASNVHWCYYETKGRSDVRYRNTYVIPQNQLFAMFTNYYKLMNISPAATEEEINTALEQSTLSGALVEEMKWFANNH